MIIKDTPDIISPLWICTHPVDKSFRCAAVSHKKDVLLIISPGAHTPQCAAYKIAFQKFQDNIKQIEAGHHLTGKVHEIFILSVQIQHQRNSQHAYGVGLYNVGKLLPSSLYPFRRIQMKESVEDQIRGNDQHQRQYIHPCHHFPVVSRYVRTQHKAHEPCQPVGCHDYQCI